VVVRGDTADSRPLTIVRLRLVSGPACQRCGRDDDRPQIRLIWLHFLARNRTATGSDEEDKPKAIATAEPARRFPIARDIEIRGTKVIRDCALEHAWWLRRDHLQVDDAPLS
jgi:hypothetical protein